MEDSWRTDAGLPLHPARIVSDFSSLLRNALHVAQLALWKATRIALLAWGTMNGLGIGLLGQVRRVSRRISSRVPRVSGSVQL